MLTGIASAIAILLAGDKNNIVKGSENTKAVHSLGSVSLPKKQSVELSSFKLRYVTLWYLAPFFDNIIIFYHTVALILKQRFS